MTGRDLTLFCLALASLVFLINLSFWHQTSLILRPLLHDKSSFVLGIGLPRTGSSSLCEALHILGFRTYHFPLLFAQSPHRYLNVCNAIVDWSTLGYRPLQLVQMFPNAKIIHTVRDLPDWLKSMTYLRKLLLLAPLIRAQFDHVFGPKTNWPSFWQRYEAEANSIPQAFHWNLCKTPAWEPLCEFLHVGRPSDAFPQKKELVLQLQQLVLAR